MSTFSTTPFLGEGDYTHEFLWLVILGGFVCFAMSWGIGANDVANAFSTSVGARAINLKQAVVIAGIFEFVGAVGLGANVTSTIRKKITKFELFEGEEDVLMLGMFCSLISAALWLYLATKYSFPVSTTHSIIGAIVGFSVAAKGMDAVDWEQVGFIVLFWIVAPLMAAIGTMILFFPLRTLILRKENSYQLSLRYWPVFVFIVAFIMCVFLIIKGLKRLDFDYEEQTGLAMGITFAVAGGIALISYFVFIYSGAVDKYVQKAVEQIAKENELNEKQKGVEMIPNTPMTPNTPNVTNATDDAPNAPNEITGNENDEVAEAKSDAEKNGETFPDTETGDAETGRSEKVAIKSGLKIDVPEESANAKRESRLMNFAYQSKEQLAKGVNVDIHDDLEELEMNIHQNSEKFDIKTEKSFAWLQVCTAALDIFAHGSNDVANAVAPFAAIVGLYNDGITSSKVAVPEWILVIGAFGMVIGLGTYGYKIMKCLGVRMVYVTSTRGYCIELSSAVIIIICSVWGYPASTTHAQVGATIGSGLMEKARSDATLTWRQVINWKLLAQVFLGWILTLVFTGVTCGVIFALFAYSPYAGPVPKNCST